MIRICTVSATRALAAKDLDSNSRKPDRNLHPARRPYTIQTYHSCILIFVSEDPTRFYTRVFSLPAKLPHPYRVSVKVAYSSLSVRKSTFGGIEDTRKKEKHGLRNSGNRPLKPAMVVRRHTPPSSQLSTPPPEEPSRYSSVSSDCEADDEGAFSMDEPLSSRSWGVTRTQPSGPYCPRRPTLHDVLTDVSLPPWTLSAFTAYLSQNHCLENLEFTTAAERYRKKYDTVVSHAVGISSIPNAEEQEHLRISWRLIMDAYIVPDGPREVNLPGDVRDELLSLPNRTFPPPADCLDAAVKIIYDLMEESVLVSFLNDVPAISGAHLYDDMLPDLDNDTRSRYSLDNRLSKRDRSRRRRDSSPPVSSSLDSALTSHSGRLKIGYGGDRVPRPSTKPTQTSSTSGDSIMTDDPNSPSGSSHDPITPPTTPPSSDVGGSPKSRNDNMWKKMTGRLGGRKKSYGGLRERRSPTTEED